MEQRACLWNIYYNICSSLVAVAAGGRITVHIWTVILNSRIKPHAAIPVAAVGGEMV